MLSASQIKNILKKEHLSISKRRGQNFLVDSGIKKRIISAVDLSPGDCILEIGPGLGALTEDLSCGAAKVLAVEKDKGLIRVLRQRLAGYKNLRLIHQDILKFDLEEEQVKVVGNLPYYITSPIIAYLLEKQRGRIGGIFITVQNELGRRLSAQKDNKDYSALSVMVQYFTQAEILFSIPKRAFYPQPKVDSVFVHLALRKQPGIKVNNEQQFFKIVRSCFQKRRKTILNCLSYNFKKEQKAFIQSVLKDSGVNLFSRAENLSLGDFARIEQGFYQRGIRIE